MVPADSVKVLAVWEKFYGAVCFFAVEARGRCACLRVAEVVLVAVSGEVTLIAVYRIEISTVAALTVK